MFDRDDPKDLLYAVGGYGAGHDQSPYMCCYDDAQLLGEFQVTRLSTITLICTVGLMLPADAARAQVAVRGKTIHTMAGAPIEDGIVVIQDGKISAIGRADQIAVPEGFKILEAAVVTPGLVDAHATVGFSGILNIPHDQDQLEHSTPIQPELRAIDAYNASDPLIEWVRGFGVTTVHTGHAPGELISGQTLIAKTRGDTVDDAVIVPSKAIAVTIAASAHKTGAKSPGTRGKTMAMLRAQLIKAREYLEKQQRAEKAGEKGEPPARDLGLEALCQVLKREQPLLVNVDRAGYYQRPAAGKGIRHYDLARRGVRIVFIDRRHQGGRRAGDQPSADATGLWRAGEFELRNRGETGQRRDPCGDSERL